MKKHVELINNEREAVITTTTDVQSVVDHASDLRANGLVGSADNRHVACIPEASLVQWCQEAGIRHDDKPAIRELLKRKILSGDISKLRVWEGSY